MKKDPVKTFKEKMDYLCSNCALKGTAVCEKDPQVYIAGPLYHRSVEEIVLCCSKKVIYTRGCG